MAPAEQFSIEQLQRRDLVDYPPAVMCLGEEQPVVDPLSQRHLSPQTKRHPPATIQTNTPATAAGSHPHTRVAAARNSGAST